MESSSRSITQLLHAWRGGDREALDKLMPLVYDALRAAAQRQMARQSPGQTLQTTALINEVYLRLVEPSQTDWKDRAHFIAFCATMMRNILVDHYRRRQRQTPLIEDEQLPQPEENLDLLELHEAMESLTRIDPRGSRVVELRFFGGLTEEEVAEVMSVSIATVKRDWQKARAWLYKELGGRPQQ